MPARSKAQQMAAGAALSAKRGETPKAKLKGASKEMAASMSEGELEAFASTKRKGLPQRKSPKRATKRAAPKTSSGRKTPAKKRVAKKRASR